MPHEPKDLHDPVHEDGKMREDQAVPRASEEEVLRETARLAREGQKELERDPKEQTNTPRE
jgi:hypothetical protein